MSTQVFDPFDRFQRQAVEAIYRDFAGNPQGRYLLVVPTGGGKTFTAVKSVTRLFEESVLDSEADRVVWVAHRAELLAQAEETFDKLEAIRGDGVNFKLQVEFIMLSQVRDHFAGSRGIKLAVIDEAHHGAAPSYAPIFQNGSIGVLGLTATPTRHDGAPLEFERESYSIGFPDLVSLGVVLRPKIINVRGGRFELDSLDENTSLEQLNTPERNEQIIKAIHQRKNDFQKVVIFVGTRDHVCSIYHQIRQSELANEYESISWITGDGNSRDEPRAEFLAREKQFSRSILVNIQVLSEGYDDPSINTVVMASPTRSKLIYMQAMGRAIRRNSANESKTAYVVEVTDDLPNIRYRIDNRWLYADVSDALEPAVVDVEFGGRTSLEACASDLMDEYLVRPEDRPVISYIDHNRYSMLLFKVYSQNDSYFHFPIFVDRSNRMAVSNFFNFLSDRMSSFVEKSINAIAAFRMVDVSKIDQLNSDQRRRYVFDAMFNAAKSIRRSERGDSWITFVTFREVDDASVFPPELVEFTNGMINAEEIITRVTTHAIEPKSLLLRLPLPLVGYVGRIVSADEFTKISRLIEMIYEIKEAEGDVDHRASLAKLLDYTDVPLEPAYVQCLPSIVREGIDYSYFL